MTKARSQQRDLEAKLVILAAQLAEDELRVLVLVARRVLTGQGRYGYLDVARDRRDFTREALEEVADGLFYTAVALLGRQHRGRGARRRARRPGTPHA